MQTLEAPARHEAETIRRMANVGGWRISDHCPPQRILDSIATNPILNGYRFATRRPGARPQGPLPESIAGRPKHGRVEQRRGARGWPPTLMPRQRRRSVQAPGACQSIRNCSTSQGTSTRHVRARAGSPTLPPQRGPKGPHESNFRLSTSCRRRSQRCAPSTTACPELETHASAGP